MLLFLRLFFLLLVAAMAIAAVAPGPILGIQGNGDNAHAYAFLILPIASSVAWPRVRPLWHFLGYVMLGGAVEIVQPLFGTSHIAEWEDWIVDIVAAGGALGVVVLVRWLGRS